MRLFGRGQLRDTMKQRKRITARSFEAGERVLLYLSSWLDYQEYGFTRGGKMVLIILRRVIKVTYCIFIRDSVI